MSSVPIGKEEIAELLSRIVDRSLVNFDEPGRYSMLRTLRHYAYDRLAESEDAEESESRHLAYFLELCRDTEAKIRGPEQLTWLQRYDAETDNFRAALEISVRRPERWTKGVELAAELIDYWIIRARLAEGHAYFLHLVQSAHEDQIEHYAIALSGLASFTRYRELEGYLELHEQAIALARRAGSPRTLAKVMFSYGYTLVHHRNYNAAEPLFRELLPYAKATDPFLEGFTLISIGDILQSRGELDEAEQFYGQALTIRESQGDLRGVGAVLGSLGQVADLRGDFERACELNRKCIEAYVLVGDVLGLASELAAGCCALWLQGRTNEAAMVLACSDQILTELGTWRDPNEQEVSDRWAKRLAKALGEKAYLSARQQGIGLSLDDALKLVLTL